MSFAQKFSNIDIFIKTLLLIGNRILARDRNEKINGVIDLIGFQDISESARLL